MKTNKKLNPKRVIKEFDKRALRRKGIAKVLSDRFGIELNKSFDKFCYSFIKKYFPKKMGNVADIGTGMGRLAKYFSQKCNRLIGIDFSEKMLTMANNYLKGKDNVTLIYNDAVDVDFLPKYFDLGVVSLVLKHNNTTRAIKIIKKLKKWCKKVLLIEHITGGTSGSDISIMRTKSWYLKQFKPMKPVATQLFKRDKDVVLFSIFQ